MKLEILRIIAGLCAFSHQSFCCMHVALLPEIGELLSQNTVTLFSRAKYKDKFESYWQINLQL
mgnify:CR=1 FL=1